MSLVGGAGGPLEAAVAVALGVGVGVAVGVDVAVGMAVAVATAVAVAVVVVVVPAGGTVLTWVGSWGGALFSTTQPTASRPAKVNHAMAVWPRFMGRHPYTLCKGAHIAVVAPAKWPIRKENVDGGGRAPHKKRRHLGA